MNACRKEIQASSQPATARGQEDINMQVYLCIFEPAAPLDKMIKADKVQLHR